MAKNGEGEILEWLGGQQGAMLALLEELVNIDGGSYDKAGVDAVGTRIRAFLESHEIACETIANETYGDALRATVGGPSNAAGTGPPPPAPVTTPPAGCSTAMSPPGTGTARPSSAATTTSPTPTCNARCGGPSTRSAPSTCAPASGWRWS